MNRYDQCDSTCTTDCGHCKGQGRPDSDVIERAARVIEPDAFNLSDDEWDSEYGYDGIGRARLTRNRLRSSARARASTLAAAGLLTPASAAEYREAYEAWRTAGQAMGDVLLRFWRAVTPDSEERTYGLDPESVSDADMAERIDSDSDWTAEQWEEWSKDLASHLPPHVDGDEAQVEIVTAWVQRVALPHTRLHEGDVDAIVIAREKLISEWGDDFAEYFEENPTPPVAATGEYAYPVPKREAAVTHPVATTGEAHPNCGASPDGECRKSWCPQNRDGEPYATGRFCPLPPHLNADEIEQLPVAATGETPERIAAAIMAERAHWGTEIAHDAFRVAAEIALGHRFDCPCLTKAAATGEEDDRG